MYGVVVYRNCRKTKLLSKCYISVIDVNCMVFEVVAVEIIAYDLIYKYHLRELRSGRFYQIFQ